MNEYIIALRPVVLAGGVEGLDPSRKTIFEGMLQFIAHLIRAAKEVDSVQVTEEYSIIVKATTDVEQYLKNIGDNVIVKKL